MRFDRFLPAHLRKPALLVGGLALLLAGVALAFRGWDAEVEDRLSRWAVGEVARRTDGTYRLVLGDLSFLPLAGSISFDSMVVVTDTARNRRRASPLPVLAWRAHECRVSGLDVPRLMFRRSFVANGLGCRAVAARIALVTPPDGKREPARDSSSPPVEVDDVAGPLGLSSFRVADVSFPAVRVTLTRPGERGGSSIHLDSARFEAGDLAFDPAADPRERRSLSATRARLTATGMMLRPDTLIELAAAGLEADLSGSTLRLAGIRHEPSIPEREWVRRVRVRRDRIRFELDSLEARGVGFRAFLADGGIAVRALELAGAELDVLSDRRIPAGRPRRHRTPQQVAAEPGPPLRIDSLLVTGGTIVYRERRPGRDRPGRFTFDAVRATVLNLDRPSRGKPLRIAASTRIMNRGLLRAEATVPLDAPDFRYELAGSLGPMPAAAFNGFLSENEPFEFAEGVIEEITFRQSTRDALARTTLTPRYRDLSVEPTGDGGGVVGSVKRSVTKFIANALVVRSRNPADDGGDFRVARTARVYDPANSWLQFLWFSLREAVMEGLQEHPDEEGDEKKDPPRRSAKP